MRQILLCTAGFIALSIGQSYAQNAEMLKSFFQRENVTFLEIVDKNNELFGEDVAAGDMTFSKVSFIKENNSVTRIDFVGADIKGFKVESGSFKVAKPFSSFDNLTIRDIVKEGLFNAQNFSYVERPGSVLPRAANNHTVTKINIKDVEFGVKENLIENIVAKNTSIDVSSKVTTIEKMSMNAISLTDKVHPKSSFSIENIRNNAYGAFSINRIDLKMENNEAAKRSDLNFAIRNINFISPMTATFPSVINLIEFDVRVNDTKATVTNRLDAPNLMESLIIARLNLKAHPDLTYQGKEFSDFDIESLRFGVKDLGVAKILRDTGLDKMFTVSPSIKAFDPRNVIETQIRNFMQKGENILLETLFKNNQPSSVNSLKR